MTLKYEPLWRRIDLAAYGIEGEVRAFHCDPYTLHAGYVLTDKGMWHLDFDEGRGRGISREGLRDAERKQG